MQQICRFEIISVSREEKSLSCSTEWDESAYLTPSNLQPKIDTVIGSNHKGCLSPSMTYLLSKYGFANFRGKMPAPLDLKTIKALQPIKDLIHTITADNGKRICRTSGIPKVWISVKLGT